MRDELKTTLFDQQLSINVDARLQIFGGQMRACMAGSISRQGHQFQLASGNAGACECPQTSESNRCKGMQRKITNVAAQELNCRWIVEGPARNCRIVLAHEPTLYRHVRIITLSYLFSKPTVMVQQLDTNSAAAVDLIRPGAVDFGIEFGTKRRR